jgi:hypothetical protein
MNTNLDMSSHSLIRSTQVSPLPIGSGRNNSIKNQMNQLNTQLTMLNAQSSANTKYDPPVPKPVTNAIIKEAFSNQILSPMIFVVGTLFVVYGLVVK